VGVYYRPPAGGEILMRKYVLNYADSDLPHYYLLQSIAQYADAAETQALPLTSYNYQSQQIGWMIDLAPQEPGWLEWKTVDRPFLSSVNNGYGGTLTLGYQPWCLSNNPVVEVPNCTTGTPWVRLLRSSSEQLSAGSGTAMSTSYDYDEPGYRRTEQGEIPVHSFIGFRWATEVAAAGERRTTTEFYNTMYADGAGQPIIGHPNDLLKGKTLWSRTGKFSGSNWHDYSGTGWQEYTETDNDYVKANYHDTDPSWPVWAYFVYANQVLEKTCGTGGCQSKRTEFVYDPGMQGGTQYGNPTEIREYDPNGTLYRTTRRWWNTRSDTQGATPAYIVDRVKAEAVYAGGGWAESNTTWYYYDQLDSHQTQVGVKGELWAVQRLLNKTEDASYVYWDAAETRYGYRCCCMSNRKRCGAEVV
jgi:hypothetical protein